MNYNEYDVKLQCNIVTSLRALWIILSFSPEFQDNFVGIKEKGASTLHIGFLFSKAFDKSNTENDNKRLSFFFFTNFCEWQ